MTHRNARLIPNSRLASGFSSILVILAWILLPVAAAQPVAYHTTAGANSPFRRLELRAGVARNLSHDPVLDLWSPGPAVSIGASTPFYLGTIGAGLRFERFSGRSAGHPSFNSLLTSLSWGFTWSQWATFEHELGVEIGNFYMVFEEDTFAGARRESELAFGAFYRVQLRLTDRAGLFIRGGCTGVRTRRRMDFIHVTTGIVIKAGMPSWLRSLLE
jgi:hypothetical protein